MESLPDKQPFRLPSQQSVPVKALKKPVALHVDDGVRDVDIVCFADFKPTRRQKVIRKIDAEIPQE